MNIFITLRVFWDRGGCNIMIAIFHTQTHTQHAHTYICINISKEKLFFFFYFNEVIDFSKILNECMSGVHKMFLFFFSLQWNKFICRIYYRIQKQIAPLKDAKSSLLSRNRMIFLIKIYTTV